MRAPLMTVATAAVLALPAAQAALPSLTVPTFSMQYGGYPSGLVDISLVSTSATSTVLSLDGVEERMHVDSSGASGPGDAHAQTSIHFKAAAGYRITAIEFTTTVYGKLAYEFPENAVDPRIDYESRNYAGVEGGIIGAGTYTSSVTTVTDPVSFGGVMQNSAGLAEFDFELRHTATTLAGRVIYSVPHPWIPGALWPMWPHAPAVIDYLDPTLTVYTEALPVPEPGQWAMLAAGVSLLAGVGARRRKRAAKPGALL